MVSPSSSTLSRTVPCVAGWDGPMLSTILLVWRCASSSESSSGGSSSFSRSSAWAMSVWSGGARGAGAAEDVADGALGDERLPLAERVVLAQRVALELLVHEDASEIGVPGEADAVEVPDEPLPPVRALEERGDARQLGIRLAHADLE